MFANQWICQVVLSQTIMSTRGCTSHHLSQFQSITSITKLDSCWTYDTNHSVSTHCDDPSYLVFNSTFSTNRLYCATGV